MGTVFLCLTIIYFILIIMGKLLAPKEELDDRRQGVSKATGVESGDMGMPGREELHLEEAGATSADAQVAAAITVALRKHRMSGARKSFEPSREAGINPWKLAGRMRGMLR